MCYIFKNRNNLINKLYTFRYIETDCKLFKVIYHTFQLRRDEINISSIKSEIA